MILEVIKTLRLIFDQICYYTNRRTMPENQKTIKIDQIITKLKGKQHSKSHRIFPLKQQEIEGLCYTFKSIVLGQPMLLELNPPVVVCGDIHGQFQDLLSIFQRVGEPPERSYLFLGDYVDRGKKSLEVFCLMMALKIKYPLNFFLLRGNHECSELNKVYGFYDECKQKFNVQLFKTVSMTFEFLPVSAIVGNRIFCVHGGLSPFLKDLLDLNKIKRPISSKECKLISDLLWSDPNRKGEGWQNNFERGVSYVYGPQVIDQFLKKHGFDFICRSHQVVEEGYQFFHQRALLTIFSAPNYCGQFDNFAGVLKVSSEMVCSIQQLKGNLKSSKKIVRKLTPVKHNALQLFQLNDNVETSKISEENPKRQRKLTGGSMIANLIKPSSQCLSQNLHTPKRMKNFQLSI